MLKKEEHLRPPAVPAPREEQLRTPAVPGPREEKLRPPALPGPRAAPLYGHQQTTPLTMLKESSALHI